MKSNRLLHHLVTVSLALTLPAAALAQTESVKKAEAPKTDTTTSIEPATLTPAIKLQRVEVLGSRIRRTDLDGPSPVSGYGQEYIRATGAMTLSDFLNQIPQNYSGIASGRGSSPDEFNPDSGQRTETSFSSFNFVLGAADSPPAQTGVSGANLRGLGSASSLVLVDGRRVAKSGAGNLGTDTRQGFVDLNTIPLGMIERIEVITDGASAIYGSDAVAGVINIILKKNYTGTEVSLGYKATEHGGARERNGSVTSGYTFGKLSGTVSIDYYDRQSLKASDRSYSKNQNHTGIVTGTVTSAGVTTTKYGVDFRLNWGYPAVIQAAGGAVFGNFDAIPGVRVVLVPTGATITPTVSQFIPVTTPAGTATVINASAQRRMNTASYLDLVPATQRTGLSGNMNYRFDDIFTLYASYRGGRGAGLFNSQPTTSITGGFGAAATLPAAFNPFNQNVTVGMILTDWGSTSQRTITKDAAGTVGLAGKIGQTWRWDLSASAERNAHLRVTRNFNGAGFASLLTNADVNLRFNPFIASSAPGAPSQAAKLETLSVYPTVNAKSNTSGADFTADGDVVDIWGGTIKLAVGGSTMLDEVTSVATTYAAVAVPVATVTTLSGGQRSQAVFAEAFLPVFGKPNAAPLLRRLDFQIAGRYESIGSYSKTVPKYGVSWAPVQSLLVRAGWSAGFRAPGVTEYLIPNTMTTSTLSDQRRTPASTPGIVVTNGSNRTPKAELSETTFAGIVYEPSHLNGLSLQANYYDTEQKDVYQLLSAQNIINNEAIITDRVTRAVPTAEDNALKQPGQITAVNRVFVNYGRVENKNLEFIAEYRFPREFFGTWRAGIAAVRTLEATRQVAPGQPPVVLEEDTASPPKWTYNASVFWKRKQWNASAFLWYLNGFDSNNAGNPLVANTGGAVYFVTPSVEKLDLRLGYSFKDGIWRGYGKNVRVSLGGNNVFDKKPPFSDTIWGFNAGIHRQLILGRTYEFSLVVPF
ncbi:MAG: TonB-dependent receptor [Undibacterium sp.]|nr:TonB-dependent receptor [Opitutaceae bacterium]